MLEQGRMPPKGMPQPSDAERQQAVAWIRDGLDAHIRKTAGDPGRVTVRRLTSGEYAYAIHDLTGIDIDRASTPPAIRSAARASPISATSSSCRTPPGALPGGGEEDCRSRGHRRRPARVLHAIPGKTGFEMSAITRIKDIYAEYGFRTVSGEGGVAFGLDKYTKAFYVAWRYQHRAALGEPNATLAQIWRRAKASPLASRSTSGR